MSKGPGATQRAILAEVQRAGRPCSAVEIAATLTGTAVPSAAAVVTARRAIRGLAARRVLECGELMNVLYQAAQRTGLYAWLPGQPFPDHLRPVEKTGNAPAVVRTLIDAWHTAEELDRSIAAEGLGEAPSPAAVPYKWLTWQGKRLLQGEPEAQVMAILRAVRAMERAGEVATYIFLDSGRIAWVDPGIRCKVRETCNGATDNPVNASHR